METDLRSHRLAIAKACKAMGIRKTARLAGLTPMRVSRFVTGQGGDDALVHYILARAVGLRLRLERAN